MTIHKVIAVWYSVLVLTPGHQRKELSETDVMPDYFTVTHPGNQYMPSANDGMVGGAQFTVQIRPATPTNLMAT